MSIFDNCRICLHEINHEPIKMTRLILKFLEKNLQLANVTKPHCQENVKQNLCAPCFNKISEFQDFFEQCKDSDEFWRDQFDGFIEKALENQIAFETAAENSNSVEADTTVVSMDDKEQLIQESEEQVLQNELDQEQHEQLIKEELVLSNVPINEEIEEVTQIGNVNSIDLGNWHDDVNDHDSDVQILVNGDENELNEVNREIIEFEYQIDEDEVEIEEVSIIDEQCRSESVGVDYRSFSYERLERENSSEGTIMHESIEDIIDEQNEVTQSALFMTTIIDENGKMKMSYKCQHCDKCFSRIYDIESHYNIHNGVKPFTCNVCGKSFRQKNILTTHQALHFGKKVECAECGKKFARRSQLILHYRMHRDEKPFVCDFEGCQAAFRQRKQLIDHSFIHTGEKNFQCSTCTKSFHTRKRLQDHIYKVHSQHRYRCDLCEKAFLKPHMLKHHMISAHNVEVDDVSHLKTLVDDLKRSKK